MCYPVFGMVLFLLTMVVLKRDHEKVKAYTQLSSEVSDENKDD